MDESIRYRGRVVIKEDVTFIKELIASHPGESRRGLSKKLCEAWNWVQPNGQLRDMVCRGLMLEPSLTVVPGCEISVVGPVTSLNFYQL